MSNHYLKHNGVVSMAVACPATELSFILKCDGTELQNRLSEARVSLLYSTLVDQDIGRVIVQQEVIDMPCNLWQWRAKSNTRQCQPLSYLHGNIGWMNNNFCRC